MIELGETCVSEAPKEGKPQSISIRNIPEMATGQYSFMSKTGAVQSFTKRDYAVKNAILDGATRVYSPKGKLVWSKRHQPDQR